MPMLRRQRRDRRATAPKRRKRRNLVKFIPEADSDFAFVAQSVFLSWLKRDPAAHGVTIEDVEAIDQAVKEYRSALAKASVRQTRNPQVVMQKDEARAKAETIVRRYANIIRANPAVSDTNKRLLRLKPRQKKLRRKTCPQHPPFLQFMGSGDGIAGELGANGGGSGIHVLRFLDASNGGTTIRKSDTMLTVRNAKPDGAVRIELYFDMIPPGEPVPMTPDQRGWPKHLRSYTRSPMEVEFPIPSEPMLIVYWGKWADTAGDTSRWSKPCVARVEGWSSSAPALPGGAVGAMQASHMSMRTETRVVVIKPRELPHLVDDPRIASTSDDVAALSELQPQRLLTTG